MERSELVKGYEFSPGQYVIFSPEELKELEEAGAQLVGVNIGAPAIAATIGKPSSSAAEAVSWTPVPGTGSGLT